MGDTNQLKWVSRHRHLIAGPVVEIGSRPYTPQSSIDYRGLCAGLEYVGVDMSEGVNVDLVLDLTSHYSAIEKKHISPRGRPAVRRTPLRSS